MKIKSKFKDCYDHAVDFSSEQFFYNRVGVLVLPADKAFEQIDEDLRSKLGLESKALSSDSESLNKLFNFIKSKARLDLYKSAALVKLVVLVGKVCIEKYAVIDKKDGKLKSLNDFNPDQEDKELYSTMESISRRVKESEFCIKSELDDNIYELMQKIGTPVAGFFCKKSNSAFEGDNSFVVSSGVCLNQKIGFFDIENCLGANQIVQEIEMFFGKKKESLENVKNLIPDSVKIQQKGFNSKSFRKEKTKK